MKNTGCVITISFIIGIIFGYWAFYFENLLNCLMFSVAVIIIISYLLYRRYKMIYIITLPVFVIFGFIRVLYAFEPVSEEVEYISEREDNIEISAVVYDVGKEYDGQYTLFLQSEYIFKDNNLIDAEVGILAIFNNADNKFYPGDEIKLYGKLIKTGTLKNPGGFDERAYYKLRNIEYKIYPDNAVKTGEKNNLKILLKKLNIKISNVYDNILPKDEAAIIKAMITGDKTDLSSYMKDLFSRAGIYHIIAISGLHIHILAFIILFLSEKFHKRYGKIFAVFFMILYCIFTGASVSALRAVIMFLIYILGKFIYRKSDILTSLFISGFLILLFQPLYLFDIGFQYSFCAVLSLIIFSKPITEILCSKFKRPTAEVLSAAISVNFIPKAVMWFYFFGISTMDIFANLIIIPFSGIVVLFGFISGVLGLFSINMAAFFSGTIYAILKLYEFVCEMLLSIPFSYILLGKPSTADIIIYLSAIFVFALYLYKRINKKIFIAFITAVIFINLFTVNKYNELKITMLDVGQGDSFVFDYDDKCFIIDGGGDFKRKIGEDTGTNILFPYLRYMGTNYVDAIFITHTDSDHIKGIIEIIDYVNIGKIFVSNKEDESELYKILYEKACKKNIEIIEICSGKEISFYDDILIKCIYPYNSNKNGNESSLVLKVIFENTSFLFTGDINTECEKEIIYSEKDIKADVLKLAHHGSKYSNSTEFIDKVKPKLAIVSAGSFARYGQPAKEVLNEFQKRNITVLNTREKGAVEIYSDGENIYYKTMK